MSRAKMLASGVHFSEIPLYCRMKPSPWAMVTTALKPGGGMFMRATLLATTVCFSIVTFAIGADLQAAIKRPTNIPPQPLASALQRLIKENHIQLVYRAELISDLRTTGANGELAPVEALAQLLSGTGLTYRYLDENTLTIVPIGDAKDTPTAAGGASARDGSVLRSTDVKNHESTERQRSILQRLRLAQAEGDAEDREMQKDRSANSPDSAEVEAEKQEIQEVIVTAQKRAERLQDVPISIAVLSGEQLDKTTAQGMLETLSRTPGVAALRSSRSQVSIRGVAPSAGTGTVAYYIDTIPFGLARNALVPDVETYDLDRVEILRGPQGTLYGASAQAGVVRILTKEPNPDSFELKARSAFSNTDDGGDNIRGDAAINVPIVERKLALRSALSYQNLSGWTDKPDQTDANDVEIRTGRFKLGAKPTEQLSIGLSAWLSRANHGAQPFSNDDRQAASLLDEPISEDYDIYGLKIGYEFSAFSLSSMTGYMDYEYAGIQDYTPTSIGQFLAVKTLSDRLDAQTFSQEVVLTASPRSVWQWTLGGMYRDSEDRIRQNSLSAGIPFDWSQGSESYAVFGEAGRRFLGDKLGFAVGLRYFHDDTFVRENISQGPAGSSPIHANPSFDSTTPRAVLTWYPSEHLSLYGSYSEGFRSGFAQGPAVVRNHPNFAPVVPDKLHNYEIGLKTALWDGLLSLESAVFYIDWADAPLSLIVPFGGTFVSAQVNSESASGPGFDFALTARPLEGLEVGVSLGWSDLTWDADIVTVSGGTPFVLAPKGERLIAAPEYTAALSASYGFPFGNSGLEGRLSVSGNYLSERGTKFLSGGAALTQKGDSLLVTRASFSVDSTDRWTTTLFVDNLNDEGGAVSSTTLSPFWSERMRPRTIGLQLEFRY